MSLTHVESLDGATSQDIVTMLHPSITNASLVGVLILLASL